MPNVTLLIPTQRLAGDTRTAATLIGSFGPIIEQGQATYQLGNSNVTAGDRKIYRLADLENWLKDHRIAPRPASAENTNKPDSDSSVLKHKAASEQGAV